MMKNPDSKANPKAQPGSLQRLVRQSKVHHSKISGPTLSQKRADRPSEHKRCAH